MKTDLMIGDWVNCDLCQEPQQIVELYETQVMLQYCDLYNYTEIEPIPLTHEILVKYGFRYYDNCYWEKYRIVENLTVLFELEHCDNDKHYYWESCKIQYVHELQHALKLCGIDKELIL